MYNDENDYELLYLVAEENEDAKEMFFEKYRPMVEITALKYFPYVKNKGYELNDLEQEGLLGLNQAIIDFKHQKNVKFVTFARVCVERQIQSLVRNVNRQKHKALNDSISIDYNDLNKGRPLLDILFDNKSLNPEDSFISEEEELELIEEIKKILTDKEFEVFELRIQGFTYQEIASLLNTSTKSVDGALSRIKNKINEAKVID